MSEHNLDATRESVRRGLLLRDAIISFAEAAGFDLHEQLIAFTHAACMVEVGSRKPGSNHEEVMQNFHTIIDQTILFYEKGLIK